MIHGIASNGHPSWSEGVHRARHGQDSRQHISARATTLDAEISRTGALQVTTDDGDKVSISFAALDQLHSESFQGASKGTRLAAQSTSVSTGVSVEINVDGSLNSGEIADIGKLLGQLAQTIANPANSPEASQFADGGSLASLQSFQFGYQEQSHVAVASSALAAV